MNTRNAIPISGLTRKAILFGAVGIFSVLTVLTAKWVLGNSISSRAENVELAAFAAELAPKDPQTRYGHAMLLGRTLHPADNAASLKELEAATAQSPYNYLLWLELGKSLERNGDSERAIAAFREAIKLAPNYAITKWSLGNSLLRQGDTDSAVPLIIAAAESDPVYADTAASLLWQVFDGDIIAVKAVLSNASVTSSRLIPILGLEKNFDEAYAIWSHLASSERRLAFADIGRTLYGQLIEAKRFRDALNVLSAISSSELSNHKLESIFDGGFESRTPNENKLVFEWRYPADPRTGLTEGNKRSGSYSFLIGFPAGTTAIKSLAQTVAVEPGRPYQFEIYSRSDLKTNGSVKWEIVNAADGKRLGMTDQIVNSAEWIATRGNFIAPADSDGIEIRLIKECSTSTCSIEGNIWFDDAAVRRTDQ